MHRYTARAFQSDFCLDFVRHLEGTFRNYTRKLSWKDQILALIEQTPEKDLTSATAPLLSILRGISGYSRRYDPSGHELWERFGLWITDPLATITFVADMIGLDPGLLFLADEVSAHVDPRDKKRFIDLVFRRLEPGADSGVCVPRFYDWLIDDGVFGLAALASSADLSESLGPDPSHKIAKVRETLRYAQTKTDPRLIRAALTGLKVATDETPTPVLSSFADGLLEPSQAAGPFALMAALQSIVDGLKADPEPPSGPRSSVYDRFVDAGRDRLIAIIEGAK